MNRQISCMLGSILLLTACGNTVSSCPPVVEYSNAQQDTAADEVAALPANDILGVLIGDYMVMRDQARACK